jgi:hypothetical protein
MRKYGLNILRILFRFSHMFITGILYIIFGLMFAAANNYMFKDISEIIEEVKNDKNIKEEKRTFSIYYNVIWWLIIEIIILLIEIYAIRNFVKFIAKKTIDNKPFIKRLDIGSRKSLLEIFKDEYSSSIMLGYVVFLFNYQTNNKLSYLLNEITHDKKIIFY